MCERQFFYSREEEVENNISLYAQQPESRIYSLFIFGGNRFAKMIINKCNAYGLKVKAILDNDTLKWGEEIEGIMIKSPNVLLDEQNMTVFIMSRFEDEMHKQVEEIVGDRDLIICHLCDFDMEYKFWREGSFEQEMVRLEEGRDLYLRLRKSYSNNLLALIYSESVGDNYMCALYYQEYARLSDNKETIIVVPSNVAVKVWKLFNIGKVIAISKIDMDNLLKFVMLIGEKESGCFYMWPFYNRQRQIYNYTRVRHKAFSSVFPEYVFRLKNYTLDFPKLYDNVPSETEMKDMGIVKDMTVVLSPYANTLPEMREIFWKRLSERLKEKGYYVVTNIAGSQKPVDGTRGVYIPFESIDGFLEYCGYFVSIRNGLCDIAGRAKCKQIVIFPPQEAFDYDEVAYDDLHIDDIAPFAEYVIHKKNGEMDTLKRVVELLSR